MNATDAILRLLQDDDMSIDRLTIETADGITIVITDTQTPTHQPAPVGLHWKPAEEPLEYPDEHATERYLRAQRLKQIQDYLVSAGAATNGMWFENTHELSDAVIEKAFASVVGRKPKGAVE